MPEHILGGQNPLLKDQFVPSFPNMPEEREKNVDTDLTRKVKGATKESRRPMLASLHLDA
jgi:hypothetical protein